MSLTPATDASAFVQRETRLLPVPHAPELSLHLADEAIPLWQKTEDELAEIGLPPPFWAFAWAGRAGSGALCARSSGDSGARARGCWILPPDRACAASRR
jgi:predicted nicotinamide N-methyase